MHAWGGARTYRVSKDLALVLVIVGALSFCAFFLPAFSQLSPASALAPAAVWVADQKILKRVDPASHQFTQSVALSHEAKALAIDPHGGSLWALVEHRVLKLAANGQTLLDLDLDKLVHGLGTPRLLAVNPYDGSVWAGGEKTVLHLSPTGQKLVEWTNSDELQALNLDPDESLWVLTKKQLVHLSPQAGVLQSVALKSYLSEPEHLAVDRIGKLIWVSGKKELLRFTLDDLARPPTTIALPSGKSKVDQRSTPEQESVKIQAILVHPTAGTLWLVTKDSLVLYDRAATTSKIVALKPHAQGELEDVALTFEPQSASLWVGGKKNLLQLNSNGDFVARLAVEKEIEAIAAGGFYLLPEIGLIEPRDNSLTNNPRPAVRFSLGTVCNAVSCGLGDEYLNSWVLDVSLNGAAVGNLFALSNGEARYSPAQRLPEGRNTLTAEARDGFGHRSSRLTGSFVIDSTLPTITLNSPKDGSMLATPQVFFTGSLSEAARLLLNGQTISVGADNRFNHGPVTAQPGQNVFDLVATDPAGNSDRKLVTVTLDNVPPVVTPPANLIVEATAQLTPVNLGPATALDNIPGAPIVPVPDKTGPFPLGVYTITWRATDAAGNVGTATQTVTVRDTTPPVLTVPGPVSVTSNVPTAVNLGNASATDIFNPVTIANNAPGVFPLGTTTVTWTATDANGNKAVGTQTVRVAASASRNGWDIPQIVGPAGIEKTTDPTVKYAALALDTPGNTMAVWTTDTWNSTYSPLQASRYKINGGWEPPQELAPDSLNHFPMDLNNVAMDAIGNALVVSALYNNGSQSVWSRRNAPGSGWSTPERIEQDGHRKIWPMVAADGQGNAMAIWVQREVSNGISDLHHTLWSNRYEPGRGWGAPQMIGTADPGYRVISNNRVAFDGQGNAIVAWATCEMDPFVNFLGGCTPYTIRANRYTAGSGWGTPQVLGVQQNYLDMQLAVSRNGSAVAIWNGDQQPRDYIKVKGYLPGLGWLPGENLLGGTELGVYEYNPRVAMDDAGSFIVVWQSFDLPLHRRSIMGAHYPASSLSSNGVRNPAQVVNLDDDSTYSRPQVALDKAGNIVAVWERTDRQQIVSRYYKAGIDWGPLSRIDTNSAGYVSHPRIIADAAGNATAVWFQTQDRGFTSESKLWANRFTPLAQNQPPTANAGPDRTVDEGSAITLDGTHSYDPEGPIYRYEWRQIAGPTVALSGANTATAAFIAPTVNADVALSFELKVVDAFQASAIDTVTITVHNLRPAEDKVPPIVFPPADLVVEASAVLTPVSLGNGYAMDNADGSLTAMPDRTGPFPLGTHTVIWSATDSAGNVGSAVQNVTVRDTTPPSLAVPPDISVTSATPVTLDLGNAVAIDLFPPVTVTNDAPGQFPPGITVVTWRATDANGNTATAPQMVIVKAPSGQAGWSVPEIIDTASGNAGAPQAAFNSKGNGMAVWVQRVGNVERIHARPYVAGSGWGAVTILSSPTAIYVSAPRVVLDSSDNANVIWPQETNINRYRIWSSRFGVGGGWSAAAPIGPEHSYTPGYGYGARIAVDAGGNAMAVWGHSSAISGAVWASRYVPGQGWGTAAEIDLLPGQTSGYPAGFPQVALDPGGKALAVWVQRGNIVSNRYLPGQGWELPVSSGPGGLANDTPLAMGVDGAGNAIAVWPQYQSPQYRPWTKRYVANTNTWETAVSIGGPSNIYISPQVAVNSNGEAIAIWIGSAGSRAGLYANRYLPGSGWGTQQLIDTNSGDVGTPVMAVGLDAAGNAIAGWFQGTDVWQGGDIWANRYVAGQGWGTAERIETGRGRAADPHLVMIPSGSAFAVWSQAPDDPTIYSRDIWFSRHSAGGASGGNAIPPAVTPPADLTIEATATLTPVNLGAATAVDDVDGPLPATPDRTGPFPLGTHKITWSAVDSSGNVGKATQTVIVRDTTPPVLTVPPDVTVTSAVPIAVNLGTATATDIFTPVAITNDAPALFPPGVTLVTWTATDPNGNRSTAVQRVTVGESFSLTITSPVPGQSVDGNTVLVTGTLEAPANTGVVVNGVVAAIDHGVSPARFYAIALLKLGSNLLTAIATRPDGSSISKTVGVTSVATTAVSVFANPPSGIAPLKVRFNVSDLSGSGIQRIEIDFNGDGTADLIQIGIAPALEYTYSNPGTYLAKIKVMDGLGQNHTIDSVVEVLGLQQQDAMLRAIYNGMLDRLRAGDINGALTSITGGMQEKYRAVFTNLGPNLPVIANQLGTMKGGFIATEFAEYVIVRDANGQQQAFLVYFLRSEDGIWRIDGM